MCKVNNFCGCGQLKAGAITGSVLSALGAFVFLLTGIICLVAANRLEKTYTININYNESQVKDAYVLIFRITGGVYLFYAILLLISTIFIIIGIIKENAGCVLVWLIMDMIVIVLTGITFLTTVFVLNFLMLFTIPVWAFSLYVWIVVLSYYNALHEGHQSSAGVVLQQPTAWPNA